MSGTGIHSPGALRWRLKVYIEYLLRSNEPLYDNEKMIIRSIHSVTVKILGP